MAELRDLPPSALAYAVMSRNKFSYEKKREWVIYGARGRVCEACEAQPGEPCLNLAKLRHTAREFIPPNRMPHDKRIDWYKVLDGLRMRGYM